MFGWFKKHGKSSQQLPPTPPEAAKSEPVTRDDVKAMAEAMFPNEAPGVITSILDEYGTEGHELERDRVQRAVLVLSVGDIDKLLHNVNVAKQDYRDVLMWAEYPEA